VFLSENDIPDLTGLESLADLTSLELVSNDRLGSLGGLQLDVLHGELPVEANPLLTTLDALAPTDMSALWEVSIHQNDGLANPDGLVNLGVIAGDLSATENASLSSVESLRDVEVQADVTISNNAGLCQTHVDDVVGCMVIGGTEDAVGNDSGC